MATKAELEAELARLKEELAQSKAASQTRHDAQPDEDIPAPDPGMSEVLSALQHGEIDTKELLHKLEELLSQKPVLTVLGIFAVGYLIGRSR